jgi:beta propeller repeat protein
MNGKNKVLILVVLFLFTAPFIFPVKAQGTETLISTDTPLSNQIVPKISGNSIVWEDSTNNLTADIILYNITTGAETLLTPDINDINTTSNPAISGNWVVWQDTQTGFYDIYRYDIFNGTAICLTPGTPGTNQMAPSIDGTRIVWMDSTNGTPDLILYDFSNSINIPTTLVVTADERDPAANPTSPAIDGDYIVWQDLRNSPDDEIYRYTISQGGIDQLTPTAAGLLTRETPAISGNWIA